MTNNIDSHRIIDATFVVHDPVYNIFHLRSSEIGAAMATCVQEGMDIAVRYPAGPIVQYRYDSSFNGTNRAGYIFFPVMEKLDNALVVWND